MNKATKILEKTLENPSQWYIKRTMYPDQAGCILGMRGWFSVPEPIGVTHHDHRMNGEKRTTIVLDTK